MHRLDVPRLHFAGTFTAGPIRQDQHLQHPPNPKHPQHPDTQHPQHPSNTAGDDGQAKPRDRSWNLCGPHAWTISARVTSFLDIRNKMHHTGDRLLGATFESYKPSTAAAEPVEAGAEPHARSPLDGLYLRLVPAGASAGDRAAAMLQGYFIDRATLLNVWSASVPSQVNTAPGSGGAFQSLLERLSWRAASSPLLSELHRASPDGLSIRLSCYGYLSDHPHAHLAQGSIVGTIGTLGTREAGT